MNNRTMFGKPIRMETTGEYFPCKISLADFSILISSNIKAFEKNMIHLSLTNDEKYIEEWTEMFLGWSEIETE